VTRRLLGCLLVAICVMACGKYGPPVRAEAPPQAESPTAPEEDEERS
jgi:hypothetical protein